ncbi:MAG: hypothetical protein ACK59A_08930 [Cyanobacteriota bacterium]
MKEIQFLFESRNGDYVEVTAGSQLVSGPIVSQNAGSSSTGIYYQVGGGGLNGLFARALGTTQLDTVNGQLRTAYDGTFGAGRWQKDSMNLPSPSPLSSFLVPIQVGTDGVGMMYSVGPDLRWTSLSLPSVASAYAQVYADAIDQLATSNLKVGALRITMLSTGIYAGSTPVADLAKDAAACILNGMVTALKARPADLENLVILINTQSTTEASKEFTGFRQAASVWGASVTDKGFVLPL